MSQKLDCLYDKDIRVPDFYFDVESDVIYLIKSIGGKKEKISSGIKRPHIAKAKREAFVKLKKKLNIKRQKASSLIRDELNHWLTVKESEGLAYDTLNNVRRAKEQIDEYWGAKFPYEITRDNLTKWYAWWREHNPTIEMENAIKYKRNFCRYLAQKIVDGRPLLPAVPDITDPNYKLIRRARKKKKENIISESDLKAILATALSDDDQLIVLIMYTMATRISETMEMSFGSEILLDQKVPAYRWSDGQNKADHDGWHALHPELIPRLTALRKRRAVQGTTRLFPQQGDNQKALREQMVDWAKWRERAGLSWHWTPHTFRHTCLSILFNDEKNPQALIIKLYRVSLAVAIETYIKPTASGIEKMRHAIKVEL